MTSDTVPPPGPPHRVRLPANIHRWKTISFLHWRFPPGAVQALLPAGLTAQAHDGTAWIGVTPFLMEVRPVPVAPFVSRFPETNVRTYVVGPDGRLGIYFLHMEVAARWFVSLRALGLPYVRRPMGLHRGEDHIAYRSQAPSAEGGHDIVVTPGVALRPATGDETARFLTARWTAFHHVAGVLLATDVEHEPWPLLAATADRWDVAGLFHAVELPVPDEPPVAHFSPGVTVRVGWPRPLRA